MDETEDAIFADAINALMNFVAMETHLLETAAETNNKEHLVLAEATRSQRQELMAMVFEEKDLGDETKRTAEGDLHCATKHALMVRMNLLELAQKYSKRQEFEKAFACLNMAKGLFALLASLR